MTSNELETSACSGAPMPANLSPALTALWMARAGQWDAAHDQCQIIKGSAGSWIHAHLHRLEGDHPNAAYWYSLAGQPVPPHTLTIDQEWHQIVTALLEKSR